MQRRSILFAVLVVAGCGGDDPVDPGPPVDPDLLRVVAAPEDTALYVGRTFQLRAQLVDSTGTQFPNDEFDYEALDDAIGVSGDGVVTGETIGRARVVVRRGTVSDTVLVSVVPEGTIAFNWYLPITQLAVAGLDGSVSWAIPPGFGVSAGPITWLPGARLVQEREEFPLPSLLYAVSQNGGSVVSFFPVQEPISEMRAERSPRASRDGEWLYFAHQDGLRRVHPDGSGLEIITSHDDAFIDDFPDPSPDGTRVVFVRGGGIPLDQAGDLIVRDLAGGSEQAVDLGGSHASLPRWSPDGQWIAYLRVVETPRFSEAVFVARPDGSEERRVTVESERYDRSGLDWSPDGAWLLARRDIGLALVEVATGRSLPLGWAPNASWPVFQP